MTRLTFFSGTRNASSWAMRAWLALRAAELDFEEILVDIRRPQRLANLAEIGRLSPPAMVPVLVAEGRIIFDSLAIMEYANDSCGGALLPQDLIDRGQARAIVAWQHSGLSAICPRISFESAFYPLKRPLTHEEINDLPRLFDWLEQLLGRSGGPFLFGAAGLADFALTPTVVRLSRHEPNLTRWPRSQRWTGAVLSHPLVAEWMDEADALPHIWFDDYAPDSAGSELHRCTQVPAGPIEHDLEVVASAVKRAAEARNARP